MRLWVFLILAALACSAPAAELPDSTAAVALTDRIMQTAAEGEVRSALEQARPYIVIPHSEFDAMLGQAELQLPMIAGRFGKPIGYEFLRNDAVGDSLMQTVYLQKFEKHAMVWRFVFYKNNKGWVLNSFKYADDFSGVL